VVAQVTAKMSGSFSETQCSGQLAYEHPRSGVGRVTL